MSAFIPNINYVYLFMTLQLSNLTWNTLGFPNTSLCSVYGNCFHSGFTFLKLNSFSWYGLLFHVVEIVTFFLDGFPDCFLSEKCEIYKTIWSIITMAKWNKSIFLYIHCKVHKNWISSKAHSLQIQQEASWWTHCNFECILIKTIMLGDQL